MKKVLNFPEQPTASIDAKTGAVGIAILRVDGKRMSKAVFRQIPVVTLTEWPAHHDILGWVRDYQPWLVWTDGTRLVRSDSTGWGCTLADGTREPSTDYLRQLYLV